MTAHTQDSPGRDDEPHADGGERSRPGPVDGADTRSQADRATATAGDESPRSRRRRRATAIWQALRDLLVITAWTVGLTAVFLATAWPRWAFYALLLGGIVAYVQVTAR